jgi:dihydroorotase
MDSDLFDPEDPYTHTKARPKEAEIESVKDQIKFAREANFEGTLHICHVSCPETVDLIDDARKYMKITCGVTPHHLMWSADEMLNRPDGLIYKMNPPLGGDEDVAGLRDRLRDGKIDWIETDHAPHALGEKLFGMNNDKRKSPSGFPSLYMYKKCVEEFLPSIGVSEDLIKKLTYTNIKDAFQKIY